jgi:hypothetical protein
LAALAPGPATERGPTVTTSVAAQILPPAPSCAALDAYAGRCMPPAGQIAVRVSLSFTGDGHGSVEVAPAGVTADSTSPPPSYGNPAFHDVFFDAAPGLTVMLTATHAGGDYFDGWAQTSNGAGCSQTGSSSPPTCQITVGGAPNVIPGHGYTITAVPGFYVCPPPGTVGARPGAKRDCPGFS